MNLLQAAFLGICTAIAVGVGGGFYLTTAETAVPEAMQHRGARPDSSDNDDSQERANRSDADTLRYKLKLLQRGRQFLDTVPGYTAQIAKQEEVHGTLLDEHVILLKCRCKPFSVYLNWISGDRGREVIYVEGQNNGKLLGHDGGWRARLPTLTLSPTCTLAMRDTRYPVSVAGIQGLIDIMSGVHVSDLNNHIRFTCRQGKETFDGRECLTFTTVYADASESPVYRKSITLIDAERNIPLSSQHYGWPKASESLEGDDLDAATLIESYQFTDCDFAAHLTDADFDRNNEEYHFR